MSGYKEHHVQRRPRYGNTNNDCHLPTSVSMMNLPSALADAVLMPSYPNRATSVAGGEPYHLAEQSRITLCSPSGLQRPSLVHSTDSPICGAIAIYKWNDGTEKAVGVQHQREAREQIVAAARQQDGEVSELISQSYLHGLCE